ncbi:hypothetical protein [Algoriphagus taiwanensis]|uniref:Tetratricopeptide repeat-containing protein n=1 Tax=Algoriphagus taiwanensis TaxID=1445656 RepID=A0ABQ6PY33_9BACT|nr:hypothetical protein Ataiwa_08230 [Algoriphagus taiwanensis]
MNNRYLIEDLEAYLDGLMEAEKAEQLVEDLKVDSALKLELEALKLAREGVQMAAWKEMIRKSQSEFLNDRDFSAIESETPTRSISPFTWVSRIAASLTLLLAGVFAVLFFSTSPESITSKHLDYQIPVMRSGEFEISTLEEAYQKKDFETVKKLASEIDIYSAKDYFILAMSNLEQGQPESSETLLLAIENRNQLNQSQDFADQIDYYLVKAYLEQGKISDAKARMEKIQNDPQHTYHQNFTAWDKLKMTLLEWKY